MVFGDVYLLSYIDAKNNGKYPGNTKGYINVLKSFTLGTKYVSKKH